MGLSRLDMYGMASTVVAAALVGNTWDQNQHQFFPTFVAVIDSKPCSLALVNFLIVLSLYVAIGVKCLFLGTLREIEMERLSDSLPVVLFDTLLIMTNFHDEFTPKYWTMFGLMFFLKMFHLLAHDRVQYIEQSENFSNLSAFRLLLLILSLLTIDSVAVVHVGMDLLANGPSIMLLFGLECPLLLVEAISITIHFFLNIQKREEADEWERKKCIVMTLDFAVVTIRLGVYLCFFFLILRHYGLPLHLIRQVFVTARAFKEGWNNLSEYRTAMHLLDKASMDVEGPELEGQICVICRDEMDKGKRLPCGHVFHFYCLRDWLKLQRECPMCKQSIFQTPPHPHVPHAPHAPPHAPLHVPAPAPPHAHQHAPPQVPPHAPPHQPSPHAPHSPPPGMGGFGGGEERVVFEQGQGGRGEFVDPVVRMEQIERKLVLLAQELHELQELHGLLPSPVLVSDFSSPSPPPSSSLSSSSSSSSSSFSSSLSSSSSLPPPSNVSGPSPPSSSSSSPASCFPSPSFSPPQPSSAPSSPSPSSPSPSPSLSQSMGEREDTQAEMRRRRLMRFSQEQ